MISSYTESVLIFAGINMILAVSFYLPFSAGLLSLCQGAFMGIGAYVAAILTLNFSVPFHIALVAGALVAGLTGLVVGFPALRIKGIYLLLMTLAFNEMVRVFFLNWNYVGAAGGFGGIYPYTKLLNVYIIVAILGFFFYRLSNSRMGLAFKSLSADETAAEVMGVNIIREKLVAFSVGALLAGLGGGLYAHHALYIDSNNFGIIRSLEILIFVILGGAETFWGALIGAFILTFLPEWLRFLKEWRMFFYGSLIIFLMIARPNGLFTKAFFKSLAFGHNR